MSSSSTTEKNIATGFAGLGLADKILSTVTAMGYEEPTPVQAAAIPLMIQGQDLLGQAATGTGKTAAFALPLIHRISLDLTKKRTTVGLVLVPTRELAMQVAQAIHVYSKGYEIHVLPVYGGAPMHQQIRSLEHGAQVVVATPGRALDLIRRGHLKLDTLQVLILDEADEMLDMGFAEDLDAIISATPPTRQTALFSATMPTRIMNIAKKHLKYPVKVAIATEKTAAGEIPRIRQIVYSVTRANKPAALGRVLDIENPTAAIVFCRTRIEVETLVETLTAYGRRVQALHGGMQQRERDRVMKAFRGGTADLLVATDVAARGLDIDHLSHVINYDVPAAAESYVHRIGRVGRAGRNGIAITLAESREYRMLRTIESLTKQKMEVAHVPTVADLRAKRLDVTRATIRERLLAGDFDDMRVVVESLSQEFDLGAIAAAAVKIAHIALTPEREEDDFAPVNSGPSSMHPGKQRKEGPRHWEVPGAQGGGGHDEGRGRKGPQGKFGKGKYNARGGGGNSTRLYIGAGRLAGVRPGDLVGAITGESGIESHALGAIEISDRFSLIEVPTEAAQEIIDSLRNSTLRGKKVSVRLDRDGDR